MYTRKGDVEFLSGLAADSKGNVFFTDLNSPQDVFKVDVDGEASLYATGFNVPRSLVFDREDNLYVADSENGAVRKVYPNGEMVTVAGISESQGYSGDGGPANEARLRYPLASLWIQAAISI